MQGIFVMIAVMQCQNPDFTLYGKILYNVQQILYPISKNTVFYSVFLHIVQNYVILQFTADEDGQIPNKYHNQKQPGWQTDNHNSQSSGFKSQTNLNKNEQPSSLIGYKYKLMDIGSSVAIFLVLTLILLALFCLLTRYFHHKLKQNLEEAAQIYSIVDQLGRQNQSQLEGNYQGFKQNERQHKFRQENKNKADYEEIEMAHIKTPLNKKQDDDIYSPNFLKKRLDSGISPLKMQNIKMESNRSTNYLKQFKPEKIITTNRTGPSKVDLHEDNKSSAGRPAYNSQEDTTQHTFVNKLVCYDSQGITVIQVNVNSIKKLAQGSFKENKNVRTWEVPVSQSGFEDQLEIYGFTRDEFACYKYSTQVEISNMRQNQDYAIKSLKTCEIKQGIEVEEYLSMKMTLETNF